MRWHRRIRLTALLLLCQSPHGRNYQRALVNIGKTVKKHRDILPNLLAAHAVSGCGTVGSYFGIGKATAVKVLESGYQFHEVGDPSPDIKAVNKEATSYISACYKVNLEASATMSDVRYKVGFQFSQTDNCYHQPQRHLRKTPNELICRPVSGCQLLTLILPPWTPCDYGWMRDEHFKSLQPLLLPKDRQYTRWGSQDDPVVMCHRRTVLNDEM